SRRLLICIFRRSLNGSVRGAGEAHCCFGDRLVTAPQLPPAPLTHGVILRILTGIMLAMFLSALDQTIVATALATIGRAYADVENLTWVVTAYLLAATVVVPIYGKLSDIYGRRPALLGGIAIFVAGSVACALAPTIGALIAARALQGLGGGGLIALSQTIVGDAVSPRERGRYQGYFGAVFAADPRARRRRARAVRAVFRAACHRAGAVRPARHHPAQSRGRGRDRLGFVWLRHHDRGHDLHAGLFRDGAGPDRERRRADA